MSRNLPRQVVLSALVASGLAWSCGSTRPVREVVNEDGETVRIEAAEEAVPAVDQQTLTQRMSDYATRRQESEGVSEGQRVATSTSVPEVESNEIPVPAAEEDEGEEPVGPSVLADRMTAYSHSGSIASVTLSTLSPGPQPPPATGTTVAGYDPFVDRGCPPEGTAKSLKNQKQDRLKNRISTPQTGDIDMEVSFAKLREPGDDTNRWLTGLAATIEGYCRSAKGTQGETCNCGKTAAALVDTHFEIVSGPSDNGQPVIAEVTPVWRFIHKHFGLEDWSSKALGAKYQGHRVRITGWLFFDEIHRLEADNTDPGDKQGKANWRATCWEIHPITSIEVLP